MVESGTFVEYDSYIVGCDNLSLGDLRLLEADLPLVVPFNSYVRLLVGSGDVIHSFTVKGMGVKVDAVPGRVNLGMVYSSVFGVFFGQCSEICGVNHSFMPILLEVVLF